MFWCGYVHEERDLVRPSVCDVAVAAIFQSNFAEELT